MPPGAAGAQGAAAALDGINAGPNGAANAQNNNNIQQIAMENRL